MASEYEFISLGQGFTNLALLTFTWGWVILCCRGYAVCYGMLNTISGVYSLDTNRTCLHFLIV